MDRYTITFADHTQPALGALADAAERCGWPDLADALRAAAVARPEHEPVPENIVLAAED